MHVYGGACIHACTCAWRSLYTCMYMCMEEPVYMHVHVHGGACIHACTCAWRSLYTCMYMCMEEPVHAHVHAHVHASLCMHACVHVRRRESVGGACTCMSMHVNARACT